MVHRTKACDEHQAWLNDHLMATLYTTSTTTASSALRQSFAAMYHVRSEIKLIAALCCWPACVLALLSEGN